jgi:hypothetical protein
MDERGEALDLFQGLTIKPLTRRLVTHLLLDWPLEPALIVDFGVASADHYRALKAAIFDGEGDTVDVSDAADGTLAQRQRALVQARIVELDAAYGNAAKLNALIQRYAPAYKGRAHFNPTDWDYLEGRA